MCTRGRSHASASTAASNPKQTTTPLCLVWDVRVSGTWKAIPGFPVLASSSYGKAQTGVVKSESDRSRMQVLTA